MATPRVFISYRRGDREIAGLLRAEIARRVGAQRVFMDTRDIAPGEDFELALDSALERGDVVLIVVGDEWSREASRLHGEDDWVRREIVAGQDAGAKLVPVVIGDATWPPPELPDDLSSLGKRQAYRIGYDDLDRDVSELLAKLGLRASRRWPVPVAGAVAVLALAGFLWLRSAPAASFVNTQIVFDGSSEMLQTFPGEDGSEVQKLKAAADHVRNTVGVRSGDHIGLRVGSGCPRNSELLVAPQRNASDVISNALQDVTYDGDGFPLAEAVVAATSDFSDPEKFGGPDRIRQIIVVTSAGDHFCSDDFEEALSRRWEELGALEGFTVKVDLIGLGITDPEELSALQSIVRVVDGRFFPAENEAQLAELLEFLLDMEPVLTAAQEVADVGGSLVDPLNSLIAALNSCDPHLAQESFAATELIASESEEPLRSLEGRDNRPTYREIYATGFEWAAALESALEPASDLIALQESDLSSDPADEECREFRASDPWIELIGAWNERVGTANDLVRVLNGQIAALWDEATELVS